MSNTGGPYSDPYGGTDPYGNPASPGGGTPSPYGTGQGAHGTGQGPYTSPAPVAPPSGGGTPYGDHGYAPPGAYGAPGTYGPPGAYAGGGYGGYPPVVGYQNAAGGWSLGLGITAVLLCFVPVLTQGIAIAAIITGAMGRKAVTEGRANNGGMALAGIIIGAASLLISVLAVIVWVSTVRHY